jgi:hypothetical protein
VGTTLAPADLTRFFTALALRLPCPVRLVLTGGSESLLLGGRRPTGDIDFGVALAPPHAKRWDEVETAILAAASEAGVAVQYSTDIDRWSSIAVPVKHQKTRAHRRVGRLSVHLLDPRCWAVYKLARYLDADVDDLRHVLGRKRPPPASLARICGESLRGSPRSSQLLSFRRHVEHFFTTHGQAVWGKAFEPARAIRAFHRAARIGRS